MLLAMVAGVGYGWTRSLRGAAACFAVVVAFASVNPAVLSSDWMPYLYVAAYLAFLVAAASVAAGQARDAWMLVLAGWFLIHGHACFLFFVPVIGVTVLAFGLWSRWRRRRSGARSAPVRRWRGGVPVTIISVVLAYPIAADLILHCPGHVPRIILYTSSGRSGCPPTGPR